MEVEIELGFCKLKKASGKRQKKSLRTSNILSTQKTQIARILERDQGIHTMDSAVERIFNRLQDEESRDLFFNRYSYYESGNAEHLWDEMRTIKRYNAARNKGSLNKQASDVFDLIGTLGDSEKKVIMFGAGTNAYISIEVLLSKGISVAAICDSDPRKHNNVLFGNTIAAPETVIKCFAGYPIMISPSSLIYQNEIRDFLLEYGVSENRIYFLDPREGVDKAYFGPSFMIPLENEFYIDAGCFDGETILDFIEFAGGGKIYGFEPDEICFERTLNTIRNKSINSIQLFQKGLWHKNETLRFDDTSLEMGQAKISEAGINEIQTTTLDDVIKPDENVTLIKMDIEGAELQALKGGKKTIQRCLPRMAICLYHKAEDIVKIPSYVFSLHPDYKLYIRKHSLLCGYDTVLYALP